MDDIAFWRDLEARFRALHDEQLQNRGSDALHAFWSSDPADGDPWYLGGATDHICTQFEWLAERAAVQLGHPGGGNAVFSWLDRLRGASPHYRPINSSHIVKGKETHWESGRIDSVCRASAEYCLKCETEELKRKRRSRRMGNFAGHKNSERPTALTPEAILRGLAAKFAKDGKLPAQDPSVPPSIGAANQKEDTDPGSRPLVKKPDRLFHSGAYASVPIKARPSLKSWGDIRISFLSDERAQIIKNGTPAETLNYAEMGFEDRRTGKPNQAWMMLRTLAEERGIISDKAKTGKDWLRVAKRMEEIRKALRKHFGRSDDPVPFVEGAGYQAVFKIDCAPSFNT
jgi:hypothetical protein